MSVKAAPSSGGWVIGRPAPGAAPGPDPLQEPGLSRTDRPRTRIPRFGRIGPPAAGRAPGGSEVPIPVRDGRPPVLRRRPGSPPDVAPAPRLPAQRLGADSPAPRSAG